MDTILFGSWEQTEDLGPSTGYLSVISMDGSNYRVLEDSPSNSPPAPSPDGKTIEYDLGDTACLYHLDSGEKELFDVSAYGLNVVKGMKIGSPGWSQDGEWLAWWVSGGFETGQRTLAVAVFDLESQNVHTIHPYSPIGASWGWLPAPVWSPDGEWLAVLTLSERNKADLWVVRRDGTEEYHLGWADQPVWRPYGQLLAYRSYPDETATLVELGVWEPQQLDLPPKSVPQVWSEVIQVSITDTEPFFSPEIIFVIQPDMTQSQHVFPNETPQIFAIWSYSNMREGLTIHREWYREGELWLVREEPWDFVKYGADGVVKDISIYDFDLGLEAGLYQLRLYIDGREQTSGENVARFTVAASNNIAPLASPDGSLVAIVEPPGTLIILDEYGAQNIQLTVDEISSLAWYPDGKLLLFSSRDRTDQNLQSGPVGVKDRLWVVNVETAETHQILNQSNQLSNPDLHDPYVSPDGGYVAAISGSGWSDDCWVARSLNIKKVEMVDGRLRETYNYGQHDFEPLTLPDHYYMYVERIIGWESAAQLKVEFSWTCTTENLDGVYLLDMSTMTAERLDD